MPKRNNVFHMLNPKDAAQLYFNAYLTTNDSLPNDPFYGNGPTPVLPDYLVAGGKAGLSITPADVDPSLYNVNPNFTSTDDYSNFYRIVKANKAGTDWYKAITRNALIQSHNLTVQSGSDRGSSLFSINYFNQQGTVMGTYYKRYSLRSNTQYNISSRVRIGENMVYTISENPTMPLANEGSYVSMAYRQLTIIPVYDIMGNLAGDYSPSGSLGNSRNPMGDIWRNRNNSETDDRLLGNMWAAADILKDLTLRTSFGGAYYNY
jgi:hypothetical protein